VKPVHYMIHVRNLEDAISFYEKALKLTVADRHRYDGATLVYMRGSGSSFELELIAPEAWPYGNAPEPGRTHIGFTVDDLEAERARLAGLGIATDGITDYAANGAHQTRYFYFTDPEGNQIEFLEPHGRFASKRS
jgi:lactoylglutathione lyase